MTLLSCPCMGLSRLQNIVTDDMSALLIVDSQAARVVGINARVTR